MEHQYPLLAELEALIPAASSRHRAVTCVDACRSLLTDGTIEDATSSSISFLTPTGSIRVDVPNGVDDDFLLSLYRQCDSVLLNEERAILVKAVVTNCLARQRANRIDSAWNLYLQRRAVDDCDFDEIGFLASITTAKELRDLTDKVKATVLELPPPSKIRFTVLSSAVPVWNAERGILRLGDKTAYFRKQANGRIRPLLDRFQSEGWPVWIAVDWEYEHLRDATSSIREKTVGWLAWHAAVDGQVSWEMP